MVNMYFKPLIIPVRIISLCQPLLRIKFLLSAFNIDHPLRQVLIHFYADHFSFVIKNFRSDLIYMRQFDINPGGSILNLYYYKMKKEIENKEDIRLLVESFYHKVIDDDIIGDIFRETLFFKWETHIPVMIDFWETMLLNTSTYKGNTMRVHIELNKKHPLTPTHFLQWEKLFFETLDEHFIGSKVSEAKKRVELMEVLMQTKIAQSNNPNFIQ